MMLNQVFSQKFTHFSFTSRFVIQLELLVYEVKYRTKVNFLLYNYLTFLGPFIEKNILFRLHSLYHKSVSTRV